MSDTDQYFHLTLGPVQGFVAQARRTRDFWAGSFLLSWMASVAILAVQKQGGDIEFPIPDSDFMKAMTGQASPEQLPQQGSVPNRFKAFGAKVGAEFSPAEVVEAMQEAWQTLCDQVWDKDLGPNLDEDQRGLSRSIWDRQIQGFWEVSWCLTQQKEASSLLDRRKNWRSHVQPEEPGVKCMMMEGWQELSGAERPEQKTLDGFWRPLRESLRHGATDLRPGEYLSALGFVKRRFVRHFRDFSASLSNGVTLKGWSLPSQVPSVLYMAAAPWYAQALTRARESQGVREALHHFHDKAEALVDFSETAHPTRTVAEATAALELKPHYAGIDGVVFHPSQLEQGAVRFGDAQGPRDVLSALNDLRRKAELPEPSSFYAMVIMDGDSLGSQMSDPDKQKAISRGLNTFTRTVPEVVREHDGFLVYAGGDDVLAMATVDSAVGMAAALRKTYARIFEEENEGQRPGKKITTSLSGGIEFAHIKTPLTFVLNDAHDLLDGVAKDQTGRDSLAVRVWKPGGCHLQWSQPWDHLQKGFSESDTDQLRDLVARFREREAVSPFTNRFMFRISDLLQRLPASFFASGGQAEQANRHLVSRLLRAELKHSGLDLAGNGERDEEVEALVADLLALATPHRRRVHEDSAQLAATQAFNGDALKLVRFLSTEGMA